MAPSIQWRSNQIVRESDCVCASVFKANIEWVVHLSVNVIVFRTQVLHNDLLFLFVCKQMTL